jgi:hypothetical protein
MRESIACSFLGLGTSSICAQPESPHAKPRFQQRDGLGDRGLADFQTLRRRGERLGLHDTNEGLHDGQSIRDETSVVSGLAVASGAQGFALSML